MTRTNPQNLSEPPTTDRLRTDVDRSATGDKVAFPDPAAAPMGTDAEAGGNPLREAERRMEALAREQAPQPEPPPQRPGWPPLVPLILGVFVLIAIVAASVL